MTFFGKLLLFFPIFFERTFPSSGGLLAHQLRFKREHRPCLSGPSARILTVFPLFGKKFYLLAQRHFGRDGKGTLGEKKNRPKSSKNKYLIANNAMHKAKYGRALNETGTAQP